MGRGKMSMESVILDMGKGRGKKGNDKVRWEVIHWLEEW
jgi:hypothetical protein